MGDGFQADWPTTSHQHRDGTSMKLAVNQSQTEYLAVPTELDKQLPKFKLTHLDSTSKPPLTIVYISSTYSTFVPFLARYGQVIQLITVIYPHVPWFSPIIFHHFPLGLPIKRFWACWSSRLQAPHGHPWNDPAGSSESLRRQIFGNSGTMGVVI